MPECQYGKLCGRLIRSRVRGPCGPEYSSGEAHGPLALPKRSRNNRRYVLTIWPRYCDLNVRRSLRPYVSFWPFGINVLEVPLHDRCMIVEPERSSSVERTLPLLFELLAPFWC